MKAKLMMMGVAAALATGAMAEITNTVKVTKFHQSNPYSGKATVEYTVGGPLPANAFAEITINTDDASATFKQNDIVTGANSHVIDFASSFGGAQLLTNASFVVTIAGEAEEAEEGPGAVQLWENGPYWAECNVGATKPEEYGYYFWWGDTVGYKRENNAWVASAGSTSSFSFSSANAPTYKKNNATLLSESWIDSTGNLAAEHDAATAHLGSPWRMPTSDEIQALVDNCTTTWITTNGVYGRLVTGKETYANRSIFLPAAGYGSDSYLQNPGSRGIYWSSTPYSDNSKWAWSLIFIDSSNFSRNYNYRYDGRSVRPVRGFAE